MAVIRRWELAAALIPVSGRIMSVAELTQPVVRVLREPSRLLRMNHCKILAVLHRPIERSTFEFLSEAFGISRSQFDELQSDLLDDRAFQQSIEQRFAEVRGLQIRLLAPQESADYNTMVRLIYYCVRLQQPEIAVDTGVLDGFTSAFILKALRDNGGGRLFSIDLPAVTEVAGSSNKMTFGSLPTGKQPGWVIPDELRDRWSLRLGPSSELLEPLLDELGTIDLFLHDSLHTHANMIWEFNTAWPRLSEGGLLLSDDIFWNTAFWKFARRQAVRHQIKRGIGLIRKGVRQSKQPQQQP